MEKMGGIGKLMPKTFALFTAGSMASLALPGMSGFVGELTVFLGLTTSDAYSATFKTVVIFLSAVGLMVTPVYLLSMVRRVFFGQESGETVLDLWVDAKPREIAIALSFLIPIVGIGFYPKIATATYDATTVAVAEHIREALPTTIAKTENASLYSQVMTAPKLIGELDRGELVSMR
jgi:NAD(P)H-quinone oxidoreductase subunit 4